MRHHFADDGAADGRPHNVGDQRHAGRRHRQTEMRLQINRHINGDGQAAAHAEETGQCGGRDDGVAQHFERDQRFFHPIEPEHEQQPENERRAEQRQNDRRKPRINAAAPGQRQHQGCRGGQREQTADEIETMAMRRHGELFKRTGENE